MIESKEDLERYIESDLKALGVYPLSLKDWLAGYMRPMIWKFEVRLRRIEFAHNCKRRNSLERLIYLIKSNSLKKYGLKLGFSIPVNTIGPGLCLAHAGTVVINENVRIGANARIHVDVNIGNASPFGKEHVDDNVPVIGNNVYIWPGQKFLERLALQIT